MHGDLGRSIRLNQSVTKLLAQRYPYTLRLTLASLFVAIVLSLPAGVRSARRRNRWDDRLLSVVSLFGLSFPNFALGPILILLFAIKFGWLPVSGAGSFASLILPAFTMGSALAAILTRMTQSSRALLAKFFKVHPGFLVDDPEGYHTELTSDLRTTEGQLDVWLLQGSERFVGDPEVSHVLIKAAREKDTRRCFLLLGAILDTPGLADRLLEALRPELAVRGNHHRAEGRRIR